MTHIWAEVVQQVERVDWYRHTPLCVPPHIEGGGGGGGGFISIWPVKPFETMM